jgi:nitrile hydratase beta subunit
VPTVERAHDLGGRTGFGAVVVEPHEPVFHEPWERTARALVYAAIVATDNPNTSAFRDAIERMDPEHYLTSSYYEHWFTAAASLAVESGSVTPEELEARAGGHVPLSRPPVEVSAEGTGAQRFQVGDPVRVRSHSSTGHTRAPSYVQGRAGVITSVRGDFSLPDVEAHSARRVVEQTYGVRFTAEELWGSAGSCVNVDLWDSYLENA